MNIFCTLLVLITYVYHKTRIKKHKLFEMYVTGDAEGTYIVAVIMLTDLVGPTRWYSS
jgi:hypothetical protein